MLKILKLPNWLKVSLIFLVFVIVVSFIVFSIKTRQMPDFGSNLGGSTDNFTPIQIEGWNALWITRPEYDGKDMPDDALVEATNIDLDIKNSIAPRKGNKILGTASTTQSHITSMHTAKSITGRELLIRASADGELSWWNKDASDWDILKTGYTANGVFSFADGATSTESEMYSIFSNGLDGLKRVRVAFGSSIAQSTTTAVTLQADGDFDSATELGFDTSGTVTINGVDYVYTHVTGLILQGMTGVANLAVNDGVISAVDTQDFHLAPTTTKSILIKNQRLYVASKSNVFTSRIDNFLNFSFSAPRVASEGEIINYPGGGDITGLADRGKYVAVFKKDSISSLEFKDYDTTLSDIATPDTIVSGINIGAINNKGITQKDYSVIYTSDDIGLVKLARQEQSDFDITTSINEKIRPTAENYDFTDTAAAIWKNKVVSAARDSSNTTFNNRVILWDALYDRVSEIRGWNASAFAVYNDKLYYGDSISKNVYQAFYDEYNDDGVSYVTTAKTKWFNFGFPNTWKEIGHLYIEGWITTNTTIKFRINFDEGGKLSSKEITIVGTGDYVQSDPPAGTFGLDPFGIRSFSKVSTNKSDTLKHFAGWVGLSDDLDKKFRNIQFEVYTSGINSNYRIMRVVPYIKALDDNYFRSMDNSYINE